MENIFEECYCGNMKGNSKAARRAARASLKEALFDASCGLAANLIDLSLIMFTFGVELSSPGQGCAHVYRSGSRAVDKVEDLLIDKATIKRAVYKATHRKYISRSKRKDRVFWEITEAGRARLRGILPRYRSKRPWDGHLYLITYDIAEERRRDRDVLREYIRKIGGGMLQISVWLTPFNPTGTLKQFIKKRNLEGTVIVSDIGKDGSVGSENLDDLIERVYELDILNAKYDSFVEEVKKGRISGHHIPLRYLAILDEDPQLPYELLPFDWLGDKAYKIYSEYFLHKTSK